MNITAEVINYFPEFKQQEYMSGVYYCYADFNVNFHMDSNSVITVFIQPEFGADGSIISMYGGGNDDDVEILNPVLEDEIIKAMQNALDQYES